MQSIIQNARLDRNYLFIFLDCGVDYQFIACLEKHIENYSNFKLKIISAKNFLTQNKDCFIEKAHFTAAIYGRLLIPEICADFERAIYIDADMICNRDISELANIDLQDNYIAAVIDNKAEINRRCDNFWKNYINNEVLLNENNYYINSGLIIFNIKKWKDLNLSQRCIENLSKNSKYILPDQDVINIICKNKIYYLDQSWNCILYAKEHLSQENSVKAINHSLFLSNIVNNYQQAYYGNDTVFHYTSNVKP